MSFLTKIKDQMIDPRMGNSHRKERVLVNAKDLRELIDCFERIDSMMRASALNLLSKEKGNGPSN
jgi:hypothetical protein